MVIRKKYTAKPDLRSDKLVILKTIEMTKRINETSYLLYHPYKQQESRTGWLVLVRWSETHKYSYFPHWGIYILRCIPEYPCIHITKISMYVCVKLYIIIYILTDTRYYVYCIRTQVLLHIHFYLYIDNNIKHIPSYTYIACHGTRHTFSLFGISLETKNCFGTGTYTHIYRIGENKFYKFGFIIYMYRSYVIKYKNNFSHTTNPIILYPVRTRHIFGIPIIRTMYVPYIHI